MKLCFKICVALLSHGQSIIRVNLLMKIVAGGKNNLYRFPFCLPFLSIYLIRVFIIPIKTQETLGLILDCIFVLHLLLVLDGVKLGVIFSCADVVR